MPFAILPSSKIRPNHKHFSVVVTKTEPLRVMFDVGYFPPNAPSGKRGPTPNITGKNLYFRAVRHMMKFTGNGASHDNDALLLPKFSP
jgi:hypothetical protein